MARTDTPATKAYWQLADLARLDGAHDAQLFALTWLAAGRMVALQQAGGVFAVRELVEPHAWEKLVDAGFSAEAHNLISAHWSSAVGNDVSRRVAAADIVSGLEMELGVQRWDVLPCLSESSGRRDYAEGTFIPEMSSLLMDMVDAPPDSEVWIPFDVKGQLTVEALRRGWRVLATSPLASWPLIRQLLLTIETGQPQPPSIRMESGVDTIDISDLRADYGLVVPPFGMRIKDSRIWNWGIAKTRSHEQFTRSESWALFEFGHRINQRIVFVTLQGVLFALGQEQRLREYLLSTPFHALQTVVALPPGTLGTTALSGAILKFDGAGPTNKVFMADLVSGRRSLQEAGDILSAARKMVLEQLASDKSRWVDCEEIAENEYSFAPSRYLRQVADLGDKVVKLGDLCGAVRPPATTKEVSSFEVAEVGLPDLNNWQSINYNIEKTTYLKSEPKAASLVKPGDVVIAIKGSVGRVALMGEAARSRPTVVSQSCLALRLNSKQQHLPAEVLVMYLRSPHGQAQLAGLQVGAGVPHISPNTLLGAVSIPMPSAERCQEILRDYDRLCELELQIASLEGEMTDIARQRWPGNQIDDSKGGSIHE
ncbi:N-6 DNA methylase [Chromobacterium haemolyticum]|uniref:N-6 DNA methylase n=1 Tax=Chromobacterium haemolyticum TaxID=394935 RepID=A0ABS3GR78_9NEIS|nr:N-6 DNA methylase [Chromobacterium haemolyticum]MBK0415813.1 N-6 DNA methylase [Chromobacterium haemolyticum]MBO0417238.1 N-6 DNA methylase [Chromobacterium haemolyticum]MBO0500318.1 N-6 DNA methylase [Chromobacterium haemolyticum]